MIDVHCHLDLYPKPSEVIKAVNERGIYVLAVTTTPKAWEGNIRLVGDAKRIRVAVGLHPELVAERQDEIDLVCSLISETRFVGEVGIDGSPQHVHSRGIQRDALRTILQACARNGGKIVSLHSRLAASDVLDVIENVGNVGNAILHWFSGSQRELERAIDLGCWFSVGPAMLANAKGRGLTAIMPRDRLLTETDGPFAQVNGRAAFPWDSDRAVAALAELWIETPSGVQAHLDANLKRLVTATSPRSEPLPT